MSSNYTLRPRSLVGGWLVACLLVACKPETAPTRQGLQTQRSCVADSDCNADQQCLFRLCSMACASDANCADGERCFDSGRGAACVRLQDNACIVSADCPARTLCMFGRCMTTCEAGSGTECLPGQTCMDGLCVGDGSLPAGAPAAGAGGPAQLGSAGSAISTPPSSAAGSGALAPAVAGAAAGSGATAPASAPQAGSSALAPCSNGSAQCQGNDVVVCDASGATHVETHCPFLCSAGACTGSCAPGSQRCSGHDRQVCNAAGNFVRIETCPSLCSPSACATGCSEGTLQCNGNALMRCTNSAFTQTQTCPYTCSNGACTGVCAPGSTQCSNGGVATCGADARWSAAVACPNACSNGACAGVCTPSTQRCGGASGFQVCSNDGQWGQTEECNDQACVAGTCTGVCTPSYTRCADASSVVACSPDGSWGDPVTCTNQACKAGRCQGDCSPGATRCKDGSTTQIEQCDNNGSWQNGQVCTGKICKSGSCSGDCSPGAQRCASGDNQHFQTCNDNARWTAAQSCSDSGTCSGAGTCTAPAPPPPPPTCAAGMSPDWYSPVQGGGNPSWNDSRWGSDAAAMFVRSPASGAGGYIVVFDRQAAELAITVRVTLGSAEAPDPGDSVEFGIASNETGGTEGRAVTLTLASLDVGEGPRQITSIATSDYTGSWQSSTPVNPWIVQASEWRGTQGNDPSWIVSFRIRLTDAGVDVTMPFKLAVGAHIHDATTDLSTPDTFTTASDAPETWAAIDLTSIACVGRASLSP